MAPKAEHVKLGEGFVERLVAHIPEEQREAFRASLTPEALAEMGQGVLRHEDYSKVRDKQESWWKDNNAKVSEYDRLKAAAAEKDTPEPKPKDVDPNAPKPLTMDDARAFEADILDINSFMSTIGMRHYDEFKEVLDLRELKNEALKAGKPIQLLYEEKVGPRRVERQQKEHESAVAKAREEGEKAGFEKAIKSVPGGAMPYPVGSSAPTTLSGLKPSEETRGNYTVDAAVATLMQEMAKAG